MVDYVLEGIVGLAVEHAHLLGEFRSAPVANQFMDRLPRLSWYDTCTRGHRVISIPWQKLVEGGGIGRPPDGALYGAKDSSPLCGAHRSQRSEEVVVSLLTHREIHFFDPSARVWSDDPFVGRYSDAIVEMMILTKGGPTCRDKIGRASW